MKNCTHEKYAPRDAVQHFPITLEIDEISCTAKAVTNGGNDQEDCLHASFQICVSSINPSQG